MIGPSNFPSSTILSWIRTATTRLAAGIPRTPSAWYRRVFDLSAVDDASKRISIDFDGVFRNALVIFNGFYLTENFSGYSPFSLDVTDFANFGGKNVLVVRADASIE